MIHEDENLQYESANGSAFSAHALWSVILYALFKKIAIHTRKEEFLICWFGAPAFPNISYHWVLKYPVF